MSTSFREPEPITEKSEPIEADQNIREDSPEDFRPIESEQDILEALGIADDVKILPSEDRQDLQELKEYLASYMEEKGLSQTIKGMQKAIQNLKKDMGLHEDADPQAVIKKIGSVARSWKEISFIRDLDDRKKILVKLIGSSSKAEMDRIIFNEMSERKIWLR
jgi:hypothetical protein